MKHARAVKKVPGLRTQPPSQRVVKGIRTPAAEIDTSQDLKKLNFILRRRHLGILDEQKMLKDQQALLEKRGIDNYFIEDFVSRNSPGFQCVARRSIEDYTANFDSETNSFKYKFTLRHIPEFDTHNVIKAMNNIQTNGFLNYYSGSEFLNPHVRKGLLPGLHLLQGQYAAAFELLCKAPRVLQQSITNKSQTNDNKSVELTHRKYAEKDIEKSHSLAKELRKHKPIELTDALCKHTLEKVLGADGCAHLIGEFAAIVWNENLSRRVRLLGSRTVCEGDFYEQQEKGQEKEQNDVVKLKELSFDDGSISEQLMKNIDVSDIMLPTLGHSTLFSKNSEWKEFTIQSLIKYGISPALEEDDLLFDEEQEENNNNNSLVRCKNILPSLDFASLPLWNFAGEYRRIIEYPQNLSWSLIPDIQLTEEELGIRSTESNKPALQKSSALMWDQAMEEQLQLEKLKQEQQEKKALLIDCDKSGEKDSSSIISSSSSTLLVTTHNEDALALNAEKIEKSLLDQTLKQNKPMNGIYTPAKKAGTLHRLNLEFELPAFVSPWMMLREICKMERYVFDEGFKRSLKQREEHRNHIEAEKAAIRRRIYNKIQRKYNWGGKGQGITGAGQGSVFPSSTDSARLMQSVFHSQGPRRSLSPTRNSPSDINS